MAMEDLLYRDYVVVIPTTPTDEEERLARPFTSQGLATTYKEPLTRYLVGL